MRIGKIEFMWKTRDSATGNCPALFRKDGGYYIQGKQVTDPEVRATLRTLGTANDCPLGDDEGYLFVPGDVIERIRDL
jgi:hypothetical protein